MMRDNFKSVIDKEKSAGESVWCRALYRFAGAGKTICRALDHFPDVGKMVLKVPKQSVKDHFVGTNKMVSLDTISCLLKNKRTAHV